VAVDDKEFEAELMYRMSAAVAREMRAKGLATEEEYQKVDKLLLEKYRPVLGMLLAGKPLT